ncbi:MAG TPA: hypothetical protein VLB86_15780 [Gaiellaceae bacterium]|nr:hypothetical protein [Gaiellaceae bacterium]
MSVRNTRLLLVAGGLVAAVVLFLVLRPSDGEDAAATTQAQTTQAATTEPATTEPATQPTESTDTSPAATSAETEPAPPQPVAFAVAVRGGTVPGGIQRWQVSQGDRVRIVVRSDEDDEIHLHGYDIEKEVGPGRPAIFVFDARLAGRFELEAHHGPGQIAQLDVEP